MAGGIPIKIKRFPLACERMSISRLRLGDSHKCLHEVKKGFNSLFGGWGRGRRGGGGSELRGTLKRFCLCYPGRVDLKLQWPLDPLPVVGLASRGVEENDHQHPLGCFSMSLKIGGGRSAMILPLESPRTSNYSK